MSTPLTMDNLLFQAGKDVVVTARFPGISNSSGMTATFYIKADRVTPDTDSSVQKFSAAVVADPDNVGATMSQFIIPAADTNTPGAWWWRVDVTDSTGKTRTADYGPLLIQAV